MSRLRSLRSEAGMTLVEVLVTISILGIAVTGILSGLGATSKSSNLHRKQVTADVIVRSYGEAIKQKVHLGGYVNCATASTYNNVGIYTPPAGYVVSQDGVLYQDSSALNVVLALDVSSSVADAGADQQVKNAAKAFLNALADTGSRVAIVTFGTRAGVLAPPTADTTAKNRPAPFTSNLAYLQSLVDGLVIPRSNTGNAQYTNWDEGLMKAKETLGLFLPGKKTRVIMVTDGNPNVWIDDKTGNLVMPTTVPQLATAVPQAVDQAQQIENRPQDTKIFAVGVSSSPNVDNLQKISGSHEYPKFSFDDADWMAVSQFSALEAALKDIALKVSAETFSEKCPNPDQGAQLLTLRAATTDGVHSEKLQIVVRRP